MAGQINLKTQNVNHREKVVVETECIFISIKNKLNGKLILTESKLLFVNLEGKLIEEFSLSRIHSLNQRKSWGFFNKGIFMGYGENYYTLKVEFPNDWKRLIEKQMSIVKQ